MKAAPIIVPTCLALSLILSSAVTADIGPSDDHEHDLYARMGQHAATAVYRPAHADFADVSGALERRVATLCDTPGAAALTVARTAWIDAVDAFSGVELLRVGPIVDGNRINRLFYWPDKRRAGERQMRALLADDPAGVTVDSMPARSVAVQGLPALERLLYGSGAETLAAPVADVDATAGDDAATGDGAGRCAVARAVAGNVHRVARELDAAWMDEGGIVRQMSAPEPDDVLFRDSTEMVRSLLTQLETGLDVLVDVKLAPALAVEPPSRRPLPFRLSGASWTNVAGNVESLRALAIDSGLAARAGLGKELAFEFRVALGHAERLVDLQETPPSSSALGEDEAGLARALASALSSLRDSTRERLAPTYGIKTGFNAQDGD